MEGKEDLNNKVAITVVASDAPSDYHLAPKTVTDNPPQAAPGSTPAAAAPPQYGVALPPGVVSTTIIKKKRGRPRKYGLDGSVTAKALSPKPISSLALSPPPVIDFSSAKRGKIRPPSSAGKHHQPGIELGSLGNGNGNGNGNGDWVSCSVGASFTPHIITVNTGEDVTMKVISFSQQGPRAICILSANGVISSVTLRQSDSSGGTLTYEGRFEILSLTGSFMPSETGGMRNRSGGMSVSLASPDGRVMGGGVAGLLVAASPVQIVVGSFLAGNHLESKNQKPEHVTVSPASNVPFTISRTVEADSKPYHSSSSFHGENWFSQPSNTMNKPADINIALPG